MVTERNIKSDSFLFLAGDYGKQYFIILKLSVRTRLISFIHWNNQIAHELYFTVHLSQYTKMFLPSHYAKSYKMETQIFKKILIYILILHEE